MSSPALDSMLLASTDPARLSEWYEVTLQPDEASDAGDYRYLRFGTFGVLFDRREDIGAKNQEPGRMILNFQVGDAREVVARMDGLGVTWLAPLEERDGSLFATAIDPDGNYVQVIQLSPEHRAAMEAK
ncbi:VOC family protein [Nonomuraea sp. NPDC050790]|uniref:VOC family protein n=1 Tax=Nonomuraea sp. NPDC050790 TaxID=3364371 RepID=UPI0037B0F000